MNFDEVAAFLLGGKSLVLGTRDAAHVPDAGRAVAVRVGSAPRQISVYIPSGPNARTVANLRDNGLLAMTVSHPPDHRTIQIKGRVLALEEAADEERVLVEAYVEQFAALLDLVGMPAQVIVSRLNRWPCVRAELLVEEVFEQTPGPQAGVALERDGT